MKLVKGWYLPDSDTHFEHYIKDGGYQTVHRNTILNHIVMNKHTLKNCVDVGSHVGFWSKDFASFAVCSGQSKRQKASNRRKKKREGCC